MNGCFGNASDRADSRYREQGFETTVGGRTRYIGPSRTARFRVVSYLPKPAASRQRAFSARGILERPALSEGFDKLERLRG